MGELSILPISKENVGAVVGAGVVGSVAGGIAGYLVGRKTVKRRSKSSRSHSSHKVKTSRKRHSRHRHTPYTARKRKDTSHRRIRYTKNGQPYIILSSGKARFIPKKSARISHKRKGGKY
jgi:membrane protein YqaA with SNARE-associated domain